VLVISLKGTPLPHRFIINSPAYGNGVANRLIHCVQGYAPSLRDAPLRFAPSNFLKREIVTTASDEDGVAKLEQCAARPTIRHSTSA